MVDESVTEEEKRLAKEEAKEAEKRLREKLNQPGADMRFMGAPSTQYEELKGIASQIAGMSRDWGLGLN